MAKKGEIEYSYPYHYLPRYSDGKFRQSKHWSWGYQFIAAQELILNELDRIEFEYLLDVGCGDGRLLQELGEQYPRKTFCGVDISQSGIYMAKALNRHENVTYLEEDITETSLRKDGFDVVTLVETLEHIPPNEVHDFIKGIIQQMAQDGKLILTVPSKNKTVSDLHYQHFSVEQLKYILSEAGLTIEGVKFIERMDFIPQFLLKIFKRVWVYRAGTRIAGWCYEYYRDNLFVGEETNTGRIFAIAKK